MCSGSAPDGMRIVGSRGAYLLAAVKRLALRRVTAAALAAVLWGCAGLPPGSGYPRAVSIRLAHPEETRLGSQAAAAARDHDGQSGFHIITVGMDGLLIRAQMIDAAERTLDLQYFIFRGDTSGQLLTEALRRAADRGVRVRILVDDGDTVAGDQQVLALDGRANIEVRVFNPFAYRGHAGFMRSLEFLFNTRRLDYRMHNKLLVADDAIAIVGGRNIGDQYFQIDPESQLADDDVFAAGPVANALSATFDNYWNSGLAIPARALTRTGAQAVSSVSMPPELLARMAGGEPFAGLISGQLPWVWAHAQVVCDSPDKKRVLSGARAGRLMNPAVLQAAASAQSELLMVTPYFIPAADEMQLLRNLRQHQVRVAILTNSLEATPGMLAQSGYLQFRVPLLQEGIELYEARALLGNTHGSGQTARRFAAMVQPQNAYVLSLRPQEGTAAPQLIWHTEVDGKAIDYLREPAHSIWQRMEVHGLSLLPLTSEQ